MSYCKQDDALKRQCQGTFLGANLIEWGMGLVAFVLISLLVDSPKQAVFTMLLGWIITTYTLVYFRKNHKQGKRLADSNAEEQSAE